MSIYLKEESDFTGPLWTVEELHDMSIRVDVYYHIDEDGQVHLDIQGMLDEIQSHLMGLEGIVDEFNEKNGFVV